MEGSNVLLHSAAVLVTKFTNDLKNELEKKHTTVTCLPVAGHQQSTAVSQQLNLQRGNFIVIILDKELIETLEHKKSRKLFTKLSSYITDRNTLFVNHSVSEEAWLELKEDFDHPDAVLIPSDAASLQEVADKICLLTTAREATESEEVGTGVSLGAGALGSSQWTNLNPRSLEPPSMMNASVPCDPIYPMDRGQPEGNSQITTIPLAEHSLCSSQVPTETSHSFPSSGMSHEPGYYSDASDGCQASVCRGVTNNPDSSLSPKPSTERLSTYPGDSAPNSQSHNPGDNCPVSQTEGTGDRCIEGAGVTDADRCNSTQLAVSGQTVSNAEDEIARVKAEIKKLEEKVLNSELPKTSETSTVSASAESDTQEEVLECNNVVKVIPLPNLAQANGQTGPNIHMHITGNFPKLNVLCNESYDGNVIGIPHGISNSQASEISNMSPQGFPNLPYVYVNPQGQKGCDPIQSPLQLPPGASLSNDSLMCPTNQMFTTGVPSNRFPYSSTLSNQFPTGSSISNQLPSGNIQTDITSYVRQDLSYNPWGNSQTVQRPGICPNCRKYKDNVHFFNGISVLETLHDCIIGSNSGPEAMDPMHWMCYDCLASIPSWSDKSDRTQDRVNVSIPNAGVRSHPSLPRSSRSAPAIFQNLHYPTATNVAPGIPPGSHSVGGYVGGMLGASRMEQPSPRMNTPGRVNNVSDPAEISYRPEIKRLDQQFRQLYVQPTAFNIPVHPSSRSDSDNTKNSQLPTYDTWNSQQTSGKGFINNGGMKVPGKYPDDIGPSGEPSPSPYQSDAGKGDGASAAVAGGDINLMELSQEVMIYVQSSMDFASSNYNWERLATLHGWSFGRILQLRQRWNQRQIDSPFLELLGREEFQNYTLRQLRDDLMQIPRKDILEKLRNFEEQGQLTPKKYLK